MLADQKRIDELEKKTDRTPEEDQELARLKGEDNSTSNQGA